jgi:tellurite resistance protein
VNATAPRIPLNFFSIPFGLLGLADCWLVAATFGLAPAALGHALVALAVAVWLVVLGVYTRGARAHGVSLATDISDPIAGPFSSLIVLTPMLAAADALYPLSHSAGTVVVDVGIVTTVVLAGWLVGQWIYGPLELAQVHPGYFLPSVAGGLVASASAALVGQPRLGETLFGFGMLSWIVIGSIVLGRLVVGPPLPDPLVPTIAIEVAPAGVATFAAFAINGGHVDLTVRLLAAYGLMMVVAQLRLLPAYRRLRFLPSFWAFTFAWAAVAFAGLFWLGATRPAGWRPESYLALALITSLTGAIALRTVIALRRRDFLPTAAPAAAPTPDSAATAGPAAASDLAGTGAELNPAVLRRRL